MEVYGESVDVVGSEDPAEPEPRKSLAGQYGWSFFAMREDAQPSQLLVVEAESGQVVLRDDDRRVRWSLVVRGGEGDFLYVDAAELVDGDVELTVKPRALGEGRSVTVPASGLLRAAETGREYLSLS